MLPGRQDGKGIPGRNGHDGANITLSNIGILRTVNGVGQRWREGCEMGLHKKQDWRCRRPDHGAASVQRSLDFILQQMGYQYKRKVICSNLCFKKSSLTSLERMIGKGKNRAKKF